MTVRLLLLALCGVWPAMGSAAPPVCADRATVVDRLADVYGEVPVEIENDGEFELFASARTGSWTIVRNIEAGQSCLLASGQGFRAEPPAVDVPV